MCILYIHYLNFDLVVIYTLLPIADYEDNLINVKKISNKERDSVLLAKHSNLFITLIIFYHTV